MEIAGLTRQPGSTATCATPRLPPRLWTEERPPGILPGTVGLNDLPLNPNPSQDQDVAEARMAPALEVIVDEFIRQVRQQHEDPS